MEARCAELEAKLERMTSSYQQSQEAYHELREQHIAFAAGQRSAERDAGVVSPERGAVRKAAAAASPKANDTGMEAELVSEELGLF